ncbi:MAG: hypothetical protein CME63_06395 [Halobacteriovoraceae bacterium]|nr:hypothetical protein [Halobacteriovoraceae bacterium]MBC97359.1 hypothetical protein [Halobacteriovoraceae bacterium]|tara:strand:+ start:22732 stop:23814 length:1083 start_codon:yes stop_codon:yes gene_type:complete
MFKLENIKQIHLEITDRCNASCPQCARNILGGKENPHLSQTELSLEDIKKIMPPDIVRHIRRVFMCGNYGDPGVARDTLEVFQYLRETNPDMNLGMNTNGGMRTPAWWGELAKVIDGRGDIKFGIDGLQDTNHLYRRNVSFDRVMANIQSFIDNGGRAVWEYIVFAHNEHLVEKARELSQKMGFEKFTVKKTGRFFSNTKLKGKERQEVHNLQGEVEYYLEKPQNPDFQNSSLQKEQSLVREFGSLENYLNQTEVACKTSKEGSIYISSQGFVFPCCWTGNQLYLWYNRPRSSEIWKLLERSGGVELIDAKIHKLGDILEGEFFSQVQKSWSCSSLEAGKLKVCSKTCGQSFNQFKDQYK